MNGILIIDKPRGATSYNIVDSVKKRFQIKKAGHAGTLDPQATGVLVVLLGNFTKRSQQFSGHDKEYEACLTLGIATDTLDGEGRVIEKKKLANYNSKQIKDVFRQFLGEIKQIPPMFSALKYKGKRLYALARQNIEVRRLPRRVYIYKLNITRFTPPHIYFTVRCSKGTYVRVLCADIAKKLGSVGYMSELRRVSSGPFNISQAVTLDSLKHFSPQKLCEALIENFPR